MHNPPPRGPPWRLALGSHRSDVRRALRQPRPALPARRGCGYFNTAPICCHGLVCRTPTGQGGRCCVPPGGACTDARNAAATRAPGTSAS